MVDVAAFKALWVVGKLPQMRAASRSCSGSDSRASDHRKQCRIPLCMIKSGGSQLGALSCLILKKPHGAIFEPESRSVTTRHFGKVWRSTPTRLIPGRPNVIQLPPRPLMMCARRVSMCFRTAGSCFHNYMFITPLNPARLNL